MVSESSENLRKPPWLTMRMPLTDRYQEVRKMIKAKGLHTVCQEANCPNRCECFDSGTATFLILGSNCTRGCTFCNVTNGKPDSYDLTEAKRVAGAALDLKLSYAVITSVTRDDLADGGSLLFELVTKEIRNVLPECQIELLIPDFKGNIDAFKTVAAVYPDVLNHNIETIERLYSQVRPGADYNRSLQLLSTFREINPQQILKSGVMVGLGETIDELTQCFADLAEHSCQILTIGQYLRPSKKHYPVIEYYHPDKFIELKERAVAAGIKVVESAPFVRSSYHARESYQKLIKGK